MSAILESVAMREYLKSRSAALPAPPHVFDLGLGVLWAWMGVVWLGVPRILGGLVVAWPVWLSYSVSIAFTLLLGPAWNVTAAKLVPKQLAAVSLLVAVACAFATFALGMGLGPIAACAFAAMSGIGGSILMLEWASRLSRCDEDRLELAIPLCSLVSVLVSCFGVVPDGAYWLVCALLPILSAAMLFCCSRAADDESQGDKLVFAGSPRQRGIRLDALRIALVTCAAYALIKFAGGSPFDPSYAESGIWNGIPHLFGLLMAVAIALFSLAHFSRLTMASIMRIVTPAIVVACLLLLAPGSSMQLFSGVLMAIAETPLIVFVTLWSMGRAHCGELEARSGFGVLMGSAQLGIFLGSLLLSPGDGTGVDSGWVIAVLCAAFVLLASFAPAGSGERPERLQAAEAASPDASGAAPADASVSLDTACAAVSERFGLSEREHEVLVLLARGHSRAYIRDALFISKNTIATHARHIYQKTGTHSQQELIVLVEGFSSNQNAS